MTKYKNINIHPLSSASKERNYLLSYNGRYYEVSLPLVELILKLKENDNEEEAINSYIKMKEGKYTIEQTREFIQQFISPIFTSLPLKSSFIYSKEILSKENIDFFSNTFRYLFKRNLIIITLIIAVILDFNFFMMTKDLLIINSKANFYLILGLLVFMLISSFFHELGHASACKYYDIKHGGIGFGLYLNFPVLYTDVTEIWTLSRSQRCVVNIAGVYFQCFILIALHVIFIITNNDILSYLILIINFGFIMTLNPFFKFDGYWIASDLLGVPNLRARSKELFSYCYKRICKQQITQIPYLLQIHSKEKYGLLIYSIVVNLFMAFYFFYIIPSFLYRFISTFPDAINELILYLSNGMTPPFALLRNMGSQLLFLGLIGYLFYNLLRPLIKRYAKQ